MSGDKSYKLEDQIGYALRLANQRHTSIFQQRVLLDLTPTQFSALIRLSEVGACSQNHLGRLISVDVATIKGVVDRLKKKGLVQLSPDTKDKRRTIIDLSGDGNAIVEQLFDIGHDVTDETLRPLTAAEATKLLQLLKKIS